MNFILPAMLAVMLVAGAGPTAMAQVKPDAPPPNTPVTVAKPTTPAKPAPPAVKAAEPAKPAGKPARLEHMQKAQAENILGEAVLDAKGDQIGRIVNVLVSAKGTPHAAVIEFAGFLGVGNRNIAVEWKALDFKVVKNQIIITLDLDAAKLKAMPTYKPDAKSVPVAAPAKPSPAKTSPAKAIPAPPPPAPKAPARSNAKPDAAKPNSAQQGAASPSSAQ